MRVQVELDVSRALARRVWSKRRVSKEQNCEEKYKRFFFTKKYMKLLFFL